MQKETPGSWSLTGCGISSSCFGGGAAAPPPAMISASATLLHLKKKAPTSLCLPKSSQNAKSQLLQHTPQTN